MNRTKTKSNAEQLAKRVRSAAEYQRKDGDCDVPTGYEVNVAVHVPAPRSSDSQHTFNYRHLFATHERSVTNADKAAELLALFQAKFPAPQYHVSLQAKYAFGRYILEGQPRA